MQLCGPKRFSFRSKDCTKESNQGHRENSGEEELAEEVHTQEFRHSTVAE